MCSISFRVVILFFNSDACACSYSYLIFIPYSDACARVYSYLIFILLFIFHSCFYRQYRHAVPLVALCFIGDSDVYRPW